MVQSTISESLKHEVLTVVACDSRAWEMWSIRWTITGHCKMAQIIIISWITWLTQFGI